jgi:hypothetical protein
MIISILVNVPVYPPIARGIDTEEKENDDEEDEPQK